MFDQPSVYPADKILTVNEIYKSIQGESTWAGMPCVFVRLTGCHLRCSWCDTEYAFYEGDKMRISEILSQVRDLKCSLVEITGGEPLLQKNCPHLASALIDSGYTVLVETSGALPIDVLPADAIKIMDLKCPDSGEFDRNDYANIRRLSPRDEVKFVIAGRHDFEGAVKIVNDYELDTICNAVLFSPVFGAIDPPDLVKWLVDSGVNARFQLQLHKYVWSPNQTGV